MAYPKTPNNLHLLHGNPGHRKLTNEPKPEISKKVKDVPKELMKKGKIYRVARKEWKRIVKELYDLKLLTLIDVRSLMAYCISYSLWLDAVNNIAEDGVVKIIKKGKKIAIVQNPYVKLEIEQAKKMKYFLTEFGMTPSSRSRIDMPKSPGDDGKFGEFMKRRSK